ncbi:MAG: hypothetical protein L0177_02780 [Chloroflexi bacterium]|nr:hypothetical protein [Chloroflexota bacterium]
MQQYLETLFRRRNLFLAPVIVIPLLALVVTFYTGRAYTLRAVVWVEQTQIVGEGDSSRVAPNLVEARRINDRLRTESFTLKIMQRSGLVEAIEAGRWPQPSRLQEQMNSNALLRPLARALNMTPPGSLNEALIQGLNMVSGSIVAVDVGDNLVVVSYTGQEPFLGQRLIEETLSLHQEEDRANRIRETEAGMDRLTRELQTQETNLAQAVERLNRFEEQFPPPPPGLVRPVEELRELQRLQQEVDLNQARYTSALNSLESLRLRSDAAIAYSDLSFRVIDSPTASGAGSASIGPRRLVLMGMMGGILGTMITSVAVVLVTWRDKKIRTRANVENLMSPSIIIEMPEIPSSERVRPLLLKSAIGMNQAGR